MNPQHHIRPTGLLCLAYVAKHFDKSVEINHLQHKLGESVSELDSTQLCRCALWVGLKATSQFAIRSAQHHTAACYC